MNQLFDFIKYFIKFILKQIRFYAKILFGVIVLILFLLDIESNVFLKSWLSQISLYMVLLFSNRKNLTLLLPMSITKFIKEFFIKLKKHLNTALFKY